MEKLFIKNRHNKNISVLLDTDSKFDKRAIIMHGLGGFKEQPYIEAMAKVYSDNGFNTLRFDPTHTIGESEGSLEDANITNYSKDLEEVLPWLRRKLGMSNPWLWPDI